MTNTEFAEQLTAALATVDSIGRALGVTRSTSFELFRITKDGFSATATTANGTKEWEVTVQKLT